MTYAKIEERSATEIMAEYVRVYRYDLTRLCLSLCRNSADADDLFQETWLKAIRFYNKYDSSQRFDKWLFSICVNTFKDSKRKHSVTKRANFRTYEDEARFLANLYYEDKINENTIALNHIIADMPDKYRIVITLHYFRDYSMSDIAEILHIPFNTVKSRLRRGKEIIQRGWNK